MGITIQRRIAVKTRVTETWKRRAASELQENLKSIDEDLARLDAEARRVKDMKDSKKAELMGRGLSMERQKRVEQKEALLQRLRDIVKIEIGTEVLEGAVEGPVEISEGDDWSRAISAEVVLQDGIVVSIREDKR
jgi:hypothetical protein